jgi:hypothetical protein
LHHQPREEKGRALVIEADAVPPPEYVQSPIAEPLTLAHEHSQV